MLLKFLILSLLSGLLSVAQAAQVTHTVQNINGRVEIHVQPNIGALDILFVVDDSGSMHPHQNRLRANVPAFVQNLMKQNVHLQVGITTTSECFYSNKVCDGKFGQGFLSSHDPYFLSKLNQGLDVGVNGSATEKPLEMARKALSENLEPGFLRPGAHLAIIFLTDEDDVESRGSLEEYVQFFSTVKSSPSQLKVVSIQAELTPSCRSMGSVGKANLKKVVEGLKGSLISICDENYGEQLSQIGWGLGSTIALEVPLLIMPDVASIVVTSGSHTLTPGDIHRGWTYDSEKNTVVLGSKIDWTVLGGQDLIISFVPFEWR